MFVSYVREYKTNEISAENIEINVSIRKLAFSFPSFSRNRGFSNLSEIDVCICNHPLWECRLSIFSIIHHIPYIPSCLLLFFSFVNVPNPSTLISQANLLAIAISIYAHSRNPQRRIADCKLAKEKKKTKKVILPLTATLAVCARATIPNGLVRHLVSSFFLFP